MYVLVEILYHLYPAEPIKITMAKMMINIAVFAR